MTKIITFENPLVNGIHARPAAEIEAVSQQFKSTITLNNVSRKTKANAKSVLAMVSAAITLGDQCQLVIEGVDEQSAFAALTEFVEQVLPHCDDHSTSTEVADSLPLPVSLQAAKPEYQCGIAVSSGMGIGVPLIFRQLDLEQLAEEVEDQFNCDTDSEWLLKSAVERLSKILQNELSASSDNDEQQEILHAHIKMVQDDTFLDALFTESAERNPIRMIAAAAKQLKAPLIEAESDYLKERALDIDDICSRLTAVVLERPVEQSLILTQNTIVVADNLTPSELLALDRTWLQGLVLAKAGQTSHSVILARSFGIPVVTEMEGSEVFVQSADSVILDANYGCLIRNPNQKVHAFYLLEAKKVTAKSEHLKPYLSTKGCSKDGQSMAIYANIAVGLEADAAFTCGAEGIGLFRTEMLFMDEQQAPSEEAQYHIYQQVLSSAKGQQVIIRTLDIGGDKPLPYLPLGEEDNPFLGYRAVRMYPEFQSIIEDQIRALLRVSAHGNVDIMIPMISCVEEVEWVHALCIQCERQLNQANIPVGHWRLGIMVEVPAAKYVLEKVKHLIAFASIGSNDLTQYFMACDRGNRKTAQLYNAFNPSFIAFLNEIAHAAKQSDIELGICGEIASHIDALPLLLAMGFNEISVASPNIVKLKARLAQLDSQRCIVLLNQVIQACSVDEVNQRVTEFWQQQVKADILDASLVIQSQATCKTEIIKQLTDNLEIQQRAPHADAVERAIWQRETIFATSLGFGVAVPHCKSSAVTTNSVSVAHLTAPIVWNETDNEAISTVIMLTMSESGGDTHMNIFSKLARKLMHAEFRQQLEQAGENGQTCGEQTIALLHSCLFDQVA